jgi:hypothetical protein
VMTAGRLIHVSPLADFLRHPTKDKTLSLEQALQQLYAWGGK